jgi:3-hydroxypropanoate dehydrogenase
MMNEPLDDRALDQLFREARTYPAWTDRPLTDDQLRALYDLTRWGPTSMNCLPARLVFLKSPEAKARLRPALMAGNVAKVEAAPVTVIVGHDLAFHERLPELFPPMPGAREMFAGDPELAAETAFRNGTLQGAYLILAARALGLDVGPMSGFDNAAVDREFFPDGRVRSNFLANIGYGDAAGLYPRGPRLPFEEAAEVL